MKIEMKNINKSFGFVKILNDAYFLLNEGEIHALIGENGAGKSTLMKILTGVYTKDKGEIFIDDKQSEFKHPKDAEKKGIVFIHQELNSLLDMSVEENIFLGKELCKGFGILDKKAMRAKSKELLNSLGVDFNMDTKLADLSVGQRQMVEIAKALLCEMKVIIMDEPTAALTHNETKHLFKIIRNLKENGVSVIYISHRMEEIFELCDTISVMRDGCFVGSKKIKDTCIDETVHMMIGRQIGKRFPKVFKERKNLALSVKSLSHKHYFKDISFDLYYGEILGIYGLMGSGRTELMKTIFGLFPKESGNVEVQGVKQEFKSPMQAILNGLGFITEDRKNEGLMLDEDIKKNISLNNFSKICQARYFLSDKKEKELSTLAISEFNVKCSGIEHICGKLSGGNQQKVIFAKWVLNKPKILILDEPTRGVDIASKKEIYTIINKLANEGLAVIMVSSEMPELIGMSDRMMIMHEGKIGGFLQRNEINEENIMILATGAKL